MKILFWGDSPTVSTGFGKVSAEILKRLSAYGHEIAILGINYGGDPYDHEEFPYRLYPCAQGNTDALYGLSKLWSVVQHEQPDLLFMLNDPWLIKDTLDRKPGEFPYMKTLAYYPVDAGPLKPEWIKILNSFDAQVCYSRFAERIVTESNKGKRPTNLHQIYHGVNTETFFPVNQQQARAKLGIPPENFIIGMIARNQPRKRFDILIKAFAEFAKDKDDARLYLHTAMHDFGFDMPDLIQQFDIADKLILTEGITPARGVEEERLNLIYNTFDVNALISLGDGFGLPVAESMATGCPQLVSGHSCLEELVDGHGGLTVNTQTWLMNGSEINTWGGLSDPDDLVTKMNILYNNQALRIKLAEDGYNFIHQEKFSWDFAAQQFQEIIQDIFHLLRKDTHGATDTAISYAGVA